MKTKFVVMLLVVLLPLGALATEVETETEPIEGISLHYGFRLQSDQLFYATAGVFFDDISVAFGLGWNNTVWLGVHAHFFADKELAAFTGLELHIIYPSEETIEFHPSLPIGFAFRTKGITVKVINAITPAFDEPIGSVLALQFEMEL